MSSSIATLALAFATGLLALLAARQRDERVALLGLLGGHVAMLLLATTPAGRASLAADLFVLTAAMLAVAVRSSFRSVEVLTSVGVACYFPVFVVFQPERWPAVTSAAVATVFFAMLGLAYTLGALRDGTATRTRLTLLALATIGYGFALAASLGTDGSAYGWSLIVLAAVLLAIARIRALPRPLSPAYLYLGLAALAVACPALLDGTPLVAALVVYAVVLGVVLVRMRGSR